MPTASGALTFRKDTTRRVVDLIDCSMASKLIAFAAALQPYTTAAIDNSDLVISYPIDSATESTGEVESLDLYAVVKFRNKETSKLHNLVIPAPKMSMFDAFDKGYRVKKETGEALAEEFATMAGGEYTFESGWLCGSTR